MSVSEKKVFCPHCKAKLDEPHYKVFGVSGMRLYREYRGRKLYEVKCHFCGCLFDVVGGKAEREREDIPTVTHHVDMVLGGAFKTSCGIYLANDGKIRGSAYAREVTCKNCLRSHGVRLAV